MLRHLTCGAAVRCIYLTYTGHRTALKWNPRQSWVFSDRTVHEALISEEAYEQVQQRMASRGASSTGRVVRTRRPYALRGLLFCGACGRRMQGNWNNGKPYYRCRFPSEYALANRIDQPANLYLAQDRLLEPLDAWLAKVFAPDRVRESLTMLEQSQPEISPELDQARRVVAECDRKLAHHRAALEAGTDPELVAG
jgi:site-specific DNA recombinase